MGFSGVSKAKFERLRGECNLKLTEKTRLISCKYAWKQKLQFERDLNLEALLDLAIQTMAQELSSLLQASPSASAELIWSSRNTLVLVVVEQNN